MTTLEPYAGHRAPSRLRYEDTPLGRLDYRLRVAVSDCSDLMVDAADMLKVLAKERDAADARVNILEAENIILRAFVKRHEFGRTSVESRD